MADQRRPRTSGRLTGKDLDDEYIFYDEQGARVHVLNGTARAIYMLCDGSRTAEEIAREMQNLYEVDATTALRDVSSTIDDLVELGLLTT